MEAIKDLEDGHVKGTPLGKRHQLDVEIKRTMGRRWWMTSREETIIVIQIQGHRKDKYYKINIDTWASENISISYTKLFFFFDSDLI